jgi:hypothetical protein
MNPEKSAGVLKGSKNTKAKAKPAQVNKILIPSPT